MAKPLKVAEYISAQLEACGKSQKKVAKEAGFTNPNILTMIKQGLTKLPIKRVNDLAEALGVNKAKLMRMVLQEYQPEILEAIEDSLGRIDVER